MSLARDRIEAAGLATAVPAFAALAQVQDKVSAYRTLARAGLPQPAALVAATAAELEDGGTGLPAFVKTPIGTASAGVRRAGSRAELRRLAADYERPGRLRPGGRAWCRQPAVPGRWPWSRRFRTRRARRVPRLRAGPRGRRGRGQPQARPGPAARAGAHGRAGRDPGLARRAVRGHDPRAGRAAVHRHQPAAGRSRSTHWPRGVDLVRALIEVASVRDVAPAAGRAGRRADPSAPARRARRGPARRAAGGGAGAGATPRCAAAPTGAAGKS